MHLSLQAVSPVLQMGSSVLSRGRGVVASATMSQFSTVSCISRVDVELVRRQKNVFFVFIAAPSQ
jgi:hypothetical protein